MENNDTKAVLTRQELYNLVWSTPLLTLSKRYSISDNGLRKICKRMNIPLPEMGHWMRIQFGKNVKIKPLPDNYNGDQSCNLVERAAEAPVINPLKKLIDEIKHDPNLSIPFPEKLKAAHKLIVEAKSKLKGKDAYESFTYRGIVSGGREILDIKVSKRNIDPSLLFMDILIKLLENRSHTVIIRNDSTYAVVKSQELKICFREKSKRVAVQQPYNTTEYRPTGILSFRIDGYYNREWTNEKKSLESFLPEILAKMEMIADKKNIEREFYRKQREERERKEQIEQDLQQRKENELAEFKALFEKAERWHKTVNLRNYLDEVERTAVNKEEIKEWLEWARKKADWYDPFISTNDESFADVDIITLTFKNKNKPYNNW